MLDLTLPSPEENLALDEALLSHCEGGDDEEILRFWEPPETFVVLGYSRKVIEDVNLNACRHDNIPILRRISGGGTILQTSGCLNYTLILSAWRHPELMNVTQINRHVMNLHAEALNEISPDIEVRGHTDLALEGRKFSGNSQRRGKLATLFHGSVLFRADLEAMEKYLAIPAKQPEYRKNRSHRDFLINLECPKNRIKKELAKAWKADKFMEGIPEERVQHLVEQKYSKREWNYRY